MKFLSHFIICAIYSTYGQAADAFLLTTQNSVEDIQPHADVIVTKYRAYQGKLQKRRWNETRGYWVDPYWITIGTQV